MPHVFRLRDHWQRFINYIGAHEVPTRAEHERARGLQRIFIAGSVPISTLLQQPSPVQLAFATLCALYAASAAWYVWHIMRGRLSGNLAQYVYLFADPLVIAGCLAIDPWLYAPLYPFLAFVVVGVGVRFGLRAMWLEWCMVVGLVAPLILLVPYWVEQRLFAFVTAFWIAAAPFLFRSAIGQLQRAHALEMERAAVHAQREFVARAAHEIRTPVQGILAVLGLWEIAIATGNRGRQLELQERLRHACLMLQTHVRDVLTVAGGEAGKLDLQPEHFDLRTIVEAVHAEYEQLAEERDLLLTVSLPSEPIDVFTDPARVAQLLGNLVSNAVKYTPPQGEIRVIVEGPVTASDAVRLRVEDTGVGIPDAMQERIFHPFDRGSHPKDSTGNSAGLGLAVVDTLAALLGATIKIDSQVGSGTRFCVTLPSASR